MKWLGRILCRIGLHKVPNRHYFNPTAWSGPCVRHNCGAIVSTPAYVKIQKALSEPDELCPHTCRGKTECMHRPTNGVNHEP